MVRSSGNSHSIIPIIYRDNVESLKLIDPTSFQEGASSNITYLSYALAQDSPKCTLWMLENDAAFQNLGIDLIGVSLNLYFVISQWPERFVNVEIVKALLDRGANINFVASCDKCNDTIFESLFRHGYASVLHDICASVSDVQKSYIEVSKLAGIFASSNNFNQETLDCLEECYSIDVTGHIAANLAG